MLVNGGRMGNSRKLYITKKWVMGIFIYYLSIFLVGCTGSIYVLALDGAIDLNHFQRALLGAMSISLAAASASYIRKLYKLCFNFSSEQNDDDQLFLKRLGTVVYFIVRPMFSVLFAILVVTGMRSGIILSTSPEIAIDEGFVYLTMVSSFYIGFLSGDFIKKLESKGKEKLDSLLNKEL
jgi:hypothetical protein